MSLRLAALLGLVATLAAADSVLATAWDPAQQRIATGSPAFAPWFWNAEQKRDAARFSRLEPADDGGVRCLRVTVGADLPWLRRSYDLAVTTGPDYLDPRCDAVRLRYRVAEGSFEVSLGGPTAYFAASDVFTLPLRLTPTPDWQEAVLPLDGALRRNLRRAGFGAAMPTIAYARWIQEGLRLTVHQGSAGVLLLGPMELLAQGRGRPFPEPPPGGLTGVGPALAPGAADLFTAFIQRDLDLARATRLPNPMWKPAAATISAGGWEVRLRGAEEVSFAGCRLRVPAAAQAIQLTVATVAVARPPQVLDFLVLAADGEVPWPALAPPPGWSREPAAAFDAFLTAGSTAGTSLALYHLRRAVPPDTRTDLLLPWSDAVCVWGSGDCAAWCARQEALRPERIRALLVAPPFRHHASESVLTISDLRPVVLPVGWSPQRSYAQPDATRTALESDGPEGWIRQP